MLDGVGSPRCRKLDKHMGQHYVLDVVSLASCMMKPFTPSFKMVLSKLHHFAGSLCSSVTSYFCHIAMLADFSARLSIFQNHRANIMKIKIWSHQ